MILRSGLQTRLAHDPARMITLAIRRQFVHSPNSHAWRDDNFKYVVYRIDGKTRADNGSVPRWWPSKYEGLEKNMWVTQWSFWSRARLVLSLRGLFAKEEAVSVRIYLYRLGVGPMWYALNRRVQLLRNARITRCAFLCNCNASALFRNHTVLCAMLILWEGVAAPVKTARCKDSTSHLSALQKVQEARS